MEIKLGKSIEQYIQLIYSQDSPLNKVQDLEERKKLACEKAKLPYDDPKTKEIIHLKNPNVNEAIFSHLRLSNPNKFILLIANQHLFWEQMQKLMEPIKADEDMLKETNLKNTISKNAEELLERIDKLSLDVFKDVETVTMGTTKVRMMTPELRLKEKA